MTLDELTQELQKADQDPKSSMDKIPPKEQHPGRGRRGIDTLFGPDSLAGNEFVEQRDKFRKQLRAERDGQLIQLGQVQPGRAAFMQNDRAEDLVDGPAAELLRTPQAIDDKKLNQAQLPESPWSDWYWPIYQGILGARYADPKFPIDSEDWKVKHDYVLANPATKIVQSGDQEAINRLSPSEKYDLLVGDPEFSLTRAMWKEGEKYLREQGQVERWMGICHGWAPAAYMFKRPQKAVELLAADGKTKLLFYPSDLKALGSLMWAQGSPPSRFIGGRCNDKDPKKDENQRVISQQCFDTNPGTFHIALINQIGLRKRSFVLDATFDYEVWNQPVYSYSFAYFNLATRRAGKLASARVERKALPKDVFSKYRSAKAHSLIGVGLKLDYVAETLPSIDLVDKPENDYRKTVYYKYDLELDEQNQIVGGEWHSNAHPDFLWTPPPNAIAASSFDYGATGEWTGAPLPEKWRKAAIAAARNGQPLGKLVAALIQRAT